MVRDPGDVADLVRDHQNGLARQRILLDAEVPYIRIQAEGRLLKTEHSERDIPLVGLALENSANATSTGPNQE